MIHGADTATGRVGWGGDPPRYGLRGTRGKRRARARYTHAFNHPDQHARTPTAQHAYASAARTDRRAGRHTRHVPHASCVHAPDRSYYVAWFRQTTRARTYCEVSSHTAHAH